MTLRSRAAWAFLLTSCLSPRFAVRPPHVVETPAGVFRFDATEDDPSTVSTVQRSFERASAALERWGRLREPVRVAILPSHQALEEAVEKPGYDWLRAWARYDEIFVQSPKTWSVLGFSQLELDELVLHEATHCLMYQLSSTRTGWTRLEIPLWFREGMASVTASQSYRRPSLEALARYYDEHPGDDPIHDPTRYYQSQSELIYGVSHHTFAFLLRRYGQDAVKKVMEEMRGGKIFPEAFEAAIGISPVRFVGDFRTYVRLRGFRGGRVHGASPVVPPN